VGHLTKSPLLPKAYNTSPLLSRGWEVERGGLTRAQVALVPNANRTGELGTLTGV
jgi:hypothetical protein